MRTSAKAWEPMEPELVSKGPDLKMGHRAPEPEPLEPEFALWEVGVVAEARELAAAMD